MAWEAQKQVARVQEAASRLGYRPNRSAQRLATGRSGVVGMIVKLRADMSADQTFFDVLTTLTAELAARDLDLVLSVDFEQGLSDMSVEQNRDRIVPVQGKIVQEQILTIKR